MRAGTTKFNITDGLRKCVEELGSFSAVARSLGVSRTAIYNSIKKGGLSYRMARTLQLVMITRVGAEIVSWENLINPKNYGRFLEKYKENQKETELLSLK